MTSGFEEAKALAETLSPDQISAFVQNVMDNIVIDLLKDTRVTRNGVTVVKDSSRQQLQEIHDAVSGREGFLVPSLEGILETSLAIVNCRSTTATALHHAIASVETYSEVPLDEKGPSQSLILQFFLTKGAGADLFTVAQAVQKSTVQGEFNKLQSTVTAWVGEELSNRVLASIGLS